MYTFRTGSILQWVLENINYMNIQDNKQTKNVVVLQTVSVADPFVIYTVSHQ